MDPSYIEAIMRQLVLAFPDHTVTLVLRCPVDRNWDVVTTSDPEPERPAAQLGEYVLKHFCPGEVRH
jgi:hypothetical protein